MSITQRDPRSGAVVILQLAPVFAIDHRLPPLPAAPPHVGRRHTNKASPEIEAARKVQSDPNTVFQTWQPADGHGDGNNYWLTPKLVRLSKVAGVTKENWYQIYPAFQFYEDAVVALMMLLGVQHKVRQCYNGSEWNLNGEICGSRRSVGSPAITIDGSIVNHNKGRVNLIGDSVFGVASIKFRYEPVWFLKAFFKIDMANNHRLLTGHDLTTSNGHQAYIASIREFLKDEDNIRLVSEFVAKNTSGFSRIVTGVSGATSGGSGIHQADENNGNPQKAVVVIDDDDDDDDDDSSHEIIDLTTPDGSVVSYHKTRPQLARAGNIHTISEIKGEVDDSMQLDDTTSAGSSSLLTNFARKTNYQGKSHPRATFSPSQLFGVFNGQFQNSPTTTASFVGAAVPEMPKAPVIFSQTTQIAYEEVTSAQLAGTDATIGVQDVLSQAAQVVGTGSNIDLVQDSSKMVTGIQLVIDPPASIGGTASRTSGGSSTTNVEEYALPPSDVLLTTNIKGAGSTPSSVLMPPTTAIAVTEPTLLNDRAQLATSQTRSQDTRMGGMSDTGTVSAKASDNSLHVPKKDKQLSSFQLVKKRISQIFTFKSKKQGRLDGGVSSPASHEQLGVADIATERDNLLDLGGSLVLGMMVKAKNNGPIASQLSDPAEFLRQLSGATTSEQLTTIQALSTAVNAPQTLLDESTTIIRAKVSKEVADRILNSSLQVQAANSTEEGDSHMSIY